MLGGILADGRNFGEAVEQVKLYVKYAPDAKDRDQALKLVESGEPGARCIRRRQAENTRLRTGISLAHPRHLPTGVCSDRSGQRDAG